MKKRTRCFTQAPISSLILPPLLFSLASCTSLKSNPRASETISAESERDENIRHAVIEIEYFLERDRYKLRFEGRDDRVLLTGYHDGRITHQNEIALQRYGSYFHKFNDSLQGFQKQQAGSLPCLNPFSLTLKQEGKTELVKGCRSRDSGLLSKLIREGETLLYSKKE